MQNIWMEYPSQNHAKDFTNPRNPHTGKMDSLLLLGTPHLKREQEGKNMDQTNRKNEKQNAKLGNDVAKYGREGNIN